MLPDRVPNPGPLTYESDALPIALRGPAVTKELYELLLLLRCGLTISDCRDIVSEFAVRLSNLK